MSGNGKMVKEMDMVNFIIVTEVYMKDIGKMTKKKDSAFYIFMIELKYQEFLKMIFS